MWLRSLRIQILGWLLVPLILLLVINAFQSYRAASETADHAYDRLLLASVRAIADQVLVVDGEIVVDLPYVALELFESNVQERIFYRVAAPSGRTITGYDDLPLPATRPKPPDQAVFYRGEYHGEPVHLAAMYKPIYDAGVEGNVLIMVAETLESREALSRQILSDALIRQGLLILAAALLVVGGLSWGVRPLLKLRDAIARRAEWDLTPIDDASVQTEARPLIWALNQHTSRIEKLIAGRQRFIADASHQVHTPLTLLRTQVDFGLQTKDPEVALAVLADARGTIDQMIHLIDRLLVLARSDPEAVLRGGFIELDLSQLARATTLEWVPEARKKQIAVSFEATPEGLPIPILGNQLLLHELIANLLDNAIRYTQAGGELRVCVIADRDRCTLEIDDNGPGIPVSERERVFERFYRGSGTHEHGSGLGLAIVRDICVSHKADIELGTPAGGRGLRALVRFPRARRT